MEQLTVDFQNNTRPPLRPCRLTVKQKSNPREYLNSSVLLDVVIVSHKYQISRGYPVYKLVLCAST